MRSMLLSVVLGLLGPQPNPSASALCMVPAGHSVILPASEGMKIIKQCSRRGVEGVLSTWQPTQLQIRDLESDLCRLLAPGLPVASGDIRKHYFQYAELVTSNQKLIYVNAIPEMQIVDPIMGLAADWQTKGVIICDGGSEFWGVEYDPHTRTFSNLSFNGSI